MPPQQFNRLFEVFGNGFNLSPHGGILKLDGVVLRVCNGLKEAEQDGFYAKVPKKNDLYGLFIKSVPQEEATTIY